MTELLQPYLGQFTYFHFLRPWWLLALVPFLWTLRYLWIARSPIGKWRKVIAPHLLKALLVRHGRATWFNPINVSLLVLVLSIIALAGPTWKQQPSPFTEDIAALVIMLDVSSSMQQSDIQPSRLERAKQKVQDLLVLRPGGLVGLIVFSGSAHSVIPLTNDPDVVNNFLNAIETEMMPRRGKFPEKALPIVEQMLVESSVPGTVLMIGDGISPKTNEKFDEYFSSQNHQLLVLGIGNDSTAATDDETGLIPLESSALKKLANDSAGHYQKLTHDNADVKSLNRRINNYFVIVDDGTRPWVDSGYYLLYPIALIILLWFRVGWTLHWCLTMAFVLGLVSSPRVLADESSIISFIQEQRLASHFMALWLTPDQKGRYYIEKGDYKAAAASFESIAWRGIAYYRDENFKAAAEMFSRIETVEGYFNLANALAQGRNYLLAVKTYNKVLALDPENESAIKNRDRLQEIIDEINLLSASQRAEEGDSSRTLGEDEPQTADGAERKVFTKREVKQLTAEELLLDEQIDELWMRQVQKNPSRFLSVKFYMQLQRQDSLEREKGSLERDKYSLEQGKDDFEQEGKQP
jgi:Ca-activated chloride channel family protein